jgi:type I restriction-modification system DNA methylase subunit
MSPETHSQLANFIWSICNLLRGPYKRNEYRKVILPLTVLRRFDCLLAPTKSKVLKDYTAIKNKPENVVRSLLLQYYRLERVFSGAITLREGEAQYVKSPTDVGTGKAKDEKLPLSEIIQVLNERFGTQFTEEDRLFFQQIKEKACKDQQVIKTALANPLDKFELGIRKLIEEFMIERMGENDKIVTRYMSDNDFQGSAFPILAKEIFETIRERMGGTTKQTSLAES